MVLALVFAPAVAHADAFEAGSLVVPMDTDHQDDGMLRAYGLVYELLRNGVPVRWVIRTGKAAGEADFTTSGIDVATGGAIVDHGYRAGPWVIDAGDAAVALPIVQAWQASYPETTVHEATEAFDGDVARYLVVAPTIAMVADGNENIARGYMEAAAIPDSALDPTWPDDSPDMLDVPELMGPTDTSHTDGLLFDADGDPVYCQLMSMHWGVNDAEDNPEVVAEVRAYLNNPTHFYAECQAVNAFENLAPHGFFLTPNGFEIGGQPNAVDLHHPDSPFGQIDGAFDTVGGSEPSYSLPPGDAYKAGDVVMITAAGTPEGVEDVWMTGFLDGQCPPDQHECGPYGKVSYLGGHQYSVDTPISANPATQGARMFLNSLFEAPCATVEGLPTLAIAVGAPETTTDPDVTLKVTYVNTSFATALDVVLRDSLPAGVAFVSASDGGVIEGDTVVWTLGNLGPGESGDLEIDITLPEHGIYDNHAALEYRVGLNPFAQDSNVTQTEYGDAFGSSGDGGSSGADGTGAGSGDAGGSDSGASAEGGGTTGGSGGGGSATEGASDGGGASDDMGGGCSCTQGRAAGDGAWWLGLVAFGLGVRRRRARALAAVAALSTSCGEDTPQAADGGTAGDGIGDDGADDGDGDGDDGAMKLDIEAPTDTPFETSGCQKIDFLFVIDSSESMKDHQENLVASFPGFATAIEGAVLADDWHVMVVDTDAQWGGAECANACATLGSCPDEPAFSCDTLPPGLCDISIGSGEIAPYGEGASNDACLDGETRYAAGGEEDLASLFSCIARVGVDGNSQERQADALVRALDPSMIADDGCNAGFLRDDAILVVTVISDEPDEASEGDPAAWHDAVVEAKGGDAAAVVVLGLLADGDTGAPLCAQPVPATRLSELLELFPNGSRASVCEPDYGPFFADAVQVIADTCADFVPPG